MIAVNHLPKALHHYECELRQCLPSLSTWRTADAEARGSALRRMALGLRAIAGLRGVEDDLLRLWPIFGLHEAETAPLWRHRRRAWWQVVHDPVPLSEGDPDPRWLKMWSTLSRRDSELRYVVHSTDVADLLVGSGVAETSLYLLPHPVTMVDRPTRVATPSEQRIVTCLGSFKGARDLHLMEQLAIELGRSYRLRVVGRGWPALAGWERDARHLTEAEFDAAIDEASVVVVPYTRFFQSGVMIRALERGVPCVAPRNAFSEVVVGSDCPHLLVEGSNAGDWADAIRQATVAKDRWKARLPDYRDFAARAYSDWWATAT